MTQNEIDNLEGQVDKDEERKRPVLVIPLIILLLCILTIGGYILANNLNTPAAPTEPATVETVATEVDQPPPTEPPVPTDEPTAPPTEAPRPTDEPTDEPPPTEPPATEEPTEEPRNPPPPTAPPTEEPTDEPFCGNGVCDPGETNGTCTVDCQCVDNGVADSFEDCSCKDVVCEGEDISSSCGSPCPDGVCGQGFTCTNGICWDSKTCGGGTDDGGTTDGGGGEGKKCKCLYGLKYCKENGDWEWTGDYCGSSGNYIEAPYSEP